MVRKQKRTLPVNEQPNTNDPSDPFVYDPGPMRCDIAPLNLFTIAYRSTTKDNTQL